MSEKNKEYWERILSDLKLRYETIISVLEQEIERLQRFEEHPYAGVR